MRSAPPPASRRRPAIAGTSASNPVRASGTARPFPADADCLPAACVPAEPLLLEGVAGVPVPDPDELPPPWLWCDDPDDPLCPPLPPLEPEPPWSGSEYWLSPALWAIAAVGSASASRAETRSAANGRRGATNREPYRRERPSLR